MKQFCNFFYLSEKNVSVSFDAIEQNMLYCVNLTQYYNNSTGFYQDNCTSMQAYKPWVLFLKTFFNIEKILYRKDLFKLLHVCTTTFLKSKMLLNNKVQCGTTLPY